MSKIALEIPKEFLHNKEITLEEKEMFLLKKVVRDMEVARMVAV